MFNTNIKAVKFFLQSLFLIIFSMALLSCGGGGDGDSGSSSSSSSSSSGGASSSSSSGGVSGVEPITPLTQSKTSSVDIPGRQLNLTGEGGADGDIEVVVESSPAPVLPNLKRAELDGSKDFETAFPKLKLKAGVNSLNVKAVQRTVAADFSCEDGTSIKGTASANFVSGVIDFTGMVDGQTLSCTATFQSVLETTIPGMFTVAGLLEDWGTDDDTSKPIEETGLISTTCPQGGGGFNDNNPFFKNCSGSFLSNYTVTDSSDVIHKAATKITFSSTGTGGGIPDLPVIPEIPDFPAAPPVPDVPNIPGAPGIPQDPVIPEIPGLPDGIPGFPDGIPGFPDGIPGLPDGIPASRTAVGGQ